MQIGNNDGSTLGMTLDPCANAAVKTSNSDASLQKSSVFTVELSNFGIIALAAFDAVLKPSNKDETSFSRVLSLSRDIADNRGVSMGKGGGATIVLTGVTLIIYEGMEVVLTASEVNDNDAFDDVVVAVIGKGDVGVMLMICEGMEVVLTASKVGDDGAFGDVVVAVIGKGDVGVMLKIYEGMEVVLTVTKVDDDGALGGVVDGLICMHNGSLYPSFLLRMAFGWRHCAYPFF